MVDCSWSTLQPSARQAFIRNCFDMLRFLPFTAPSRYVFTDPNTGYEYHSKNKEELIKHIINYRAQNGYEPIEHLDLVLENYWCQLPENAGNCQKYKLKRGWFATWNGAIQVLKNIYYGEANMVDKQEADRRAEICVKCPHNIFPDKTDFIEWSDEVAEASTGGRKCDKHTELGNCGVCSCPLRAKVWAKHFNVSEADNTRLPNFCWQKL